MTAFEVYINGRKVCIAGLSEAGVVSQTLSWVLGDNTKAKEELEFHVGGLKSRTHTHLDWVHRILKSGDEVRIVVTERERVSKPKMQRRESEATHEEQKLKYLKHLAGELGFELSKKDRAFSE